METQVYAGKYMPAEHSVTVIRNRKCFSKPHGGFWTSTKRGNGSAFIEWCECEYEAFLTDRRRWEVVVKPDVKVFDFHGSEDIVKLQELQVLEENEMGQVQINWEELSKHYDAFHLCEEAVQFEEINLWGWDAESTVWFRWCFDGSRELCND